jgi:AraC-like DNA-binding protein
MMYASYHPQAPLDEFVDCFWLIAGGQAPRKERILPSGTSELVMNLHDDEIHIQRPGRRGNYERLSGAVVSGTYSGVFVCDAMEHRSMLGVHFKPGGALPLLGVIASELSDAHTDLENLWGRPACDLRERLYAATTPRQRFQIMERALVHRLRRARKIHPGVQAALEMFGPAGTHGSVRDVARDVGLCQRRFIQLFAAQVGLTPKRLCRVLRFQRARALAEGMGRRDFLGDETYPDTAEMQWAQLASRCGYCDQSHFIHEFRELSGLTPAEYLRQFRQGGRSKDNHVAVSGPVNFLQ